jgi:hypothetical protein
VASQTGNEDLSPVTKAWQKAFGGHHTVAALISHVVPIVLNVLDSLFSLTFSRPLSIQG